MIFPSYLNLQGMAGVPGMLIPIPMGGMTTTSRVAASAMHAQTKRLRVIAENLANAKSTAMTPGGDAYRRKTISFQSHLDRHTGAHIVKVGKIDRDMGAQPMIYRPNDPGADASGMVKQTNVEPLIELADMRDAHRSYDANLQAYTTAMTMVKRTLSLMEN